MADYLCNICQRELGKGVFDCPARIDKNCAMQADVVYPPQRKEGFIFLCLSFFGLYAFLANKLIWGRVSDDFFIITGQLAAVSILLLAICLCIFFSYSMLLTRTERIWSEKQIIFWKARYVRGYCYSVRLLSELFLIAIDQEVAKSEDQNLFNRLKKKYKIELVDLLQELAETGKIKLYVARAYLSGHDGMSTVQESKMVVVRISESADQESCNKEQDNLLETKVLKFLKNENFPVGLDELIENIYPETDTFAKVIVGEARSLFSLYALRIASVIFLLLFLSFAMYGANVYKFITLKSLFEEHHSGVSSYFSSFFSNIYDTGADLTEKGMRYIPTENDLKRIEAKYKQLQKEAPEQLEAYIEQIKPLIDEALLSTDYQILEKARQIDELSKKVEKVEDYINPLLQGLN